VRLTAASMPITTGYSDEALCIYGEYYHAKDLFAQRILERARDAECGVSQSIVTKTELQRSEIYNDYVKPFDLGSMMWAKLVEQPNYFAAISFTRPDAIAPFDQPELELIAALIPHIRQALQLSNTLRSLEASNAMLSRGLEEMEIAICMVRQDGSILRTTEGAERQLAARNGIWLRNGRLHTAVSGEQQALDALILGACRTGANCGLENTIRVQSSATAGVKIKAWSAQAGGAMLITRRPPLRPLQVVVSPFCAGSLLNEPQAAALMQFSDSFALPRSRNTVLRALYGLTPTESRLAELLLQGLEIREAAERMSTAFETARSHLKRLMAKTGTRRQTELLRLMLSLPGA
jgi:DNA-binding CsgD family transcriptional regulator